MTQNRKLPLLKALDCVGISTTRYYQWKKAPDADDKRTHPNRRGIVTNPQPERALSQEERQVIVNVLKDPKYSDLSIPQLRYRLIDESGQIIASERTFYRIAHQEHLVAKRKTPNSSGLPEGTFRRLPCKADAPNEVWCWDVSLVQYVDKNGNEKTAYIHSIIDLYSRLVINISAEADQKGVTARRFFEQAFKKHNITRESGLVIHSDNGSAMRSQELLDLLLSDEYDNKVSYSHPNCSNENAFAESFFGTLKGPMAFSAKRYRTLQECDQGVKEYARIYNEDRYHKGINFVTPASRYYGKDSEIVERRNQAQLRHFQEHPERYIGNKVHEHKVAGTQYLNWYGPPRVFTSKSKRHGSEQSCGSEQANDAPEARSHQETSQGRKSVSSKRARKRG